MEINTDQYLPNITVAITDIQGRPAAVDGAPVLASSDANVLQVAPSADGMTAVGTPVGPGTARVVVTADGDLTDGIRQIVGQSEDIVVTLGPSRQAAAVIIDLGAIADKPAA